MLINRTLKKKFREKSNDNETFYDSVIGVNLLVGNN